MIWPQTLPISRRVKGAHQPGRAIWSGPAIASGIDYVMFKIAAKSLAFVAAGGIAFAASVPVASAQRQEISNDCASAAPGAIWPCRACRGQRVQGCNGPRARAGLSCDQGQLAGKGCVDQPHRQRRRTARRQDELLRSAARSRAPTELPCATMSMAAANRAGTMAAVFRTTLRCRCSASSHLQARPQSGSVPALRASRWCSTTGRVCRSSR